MACNTEWNPGGWVNLGDVGHAYEIGLHFTANDVWCTGGWFYTGTGAGWTGAVCHLWDWGTGALLSTVTVVTGASGHIYPFNWPAPVALTPGHDYVISFDKVFGSVYAGNLDDAFPSADAYVTPVAWLYGSPGNVMPTLALGARAGIFPQVCSGAYCAYGTEVKPGIPNILLLAPNILLSLALSVTTGWGWAIVGVFAGQYLNVQNLCATIRPVAPVFTWQEILDLIPAPGKTPSITTQLKAEQWLHWAAWGVYCQCVAGSPAPLSPPPETQSKPTGAPDSPLATFTCDDTTLCQQVETLTLAVTSLAQQVASTLGLVTLIQRQDAPFGYVPGAIHAGLSGAGDFAVQGLIGLACTFTTLPDAYPPTAGDPDTYHQLGKLSIGTVDGWERSWQPTHSPYLILPISGAITKVGYSFADGIVATLTELVREP